MIRTLAICRPLESFQASATSPANKGNAVASVRKISHRVGAQSSSNQFLCVSYDPILFCGPHRTSRGPEAKGNLIRKVAYSPPVMGNSVHA